MNSLRFLLIVFALCFARLAHAELSAVPDPLSYSFDKAPVIIVAQVAGYTKAEPIPTFSISDWRRIIPAVPSPSRLAFPPTDSLIAEAGTYRFRPLYFLKGKGHLPFHVAFPDLRTGPYNGSSFSLAEQDTVLLLLKYDSRGQLQPARTSPALIRLTNSNDTNQEPALGGSVKERIVQLLSASLKDDALRPSAAYFLQGFSDACLPALLWPYAQDKNLLVRDAILFGLAFNQQVDAIPLIIKLNDRLLIQTDSGANSVMALEGFRTPRAVPLLNQLLFNHSASVRMMAGQALRALRSRTSVPYLVLSLHDTNTEVAAIAYFGLHEIMPSIGPYHDSLYFDAHRQAEIKKIMAWWRDELNGAHSPANMTKPLVVAPH